MRTTTLNYARGSWSMVTAVGFYSYGELSPYVGGGPCDLHNQTMTLTTIAET